MLLFAEDLDGAKIHVQAPTQIVMLCGGQCSSLSSTTPLSIRDAFLKISSNPALGNAVLVMAEDLNVASIFDEHYKDLLAFETHLAQITELILLFCESEGSVAELGAFSMVPEIAARLLVIVRDKYWPAESFVTLGPLRFLKNEHKNSVYILSDADIDLVGRSASSINITALEQILRDPLRLRLEHVRDSTTFAPERSGHVIKLIVGLIQEYGALNREEISELLTCLEVTVSDSLIHGYLLCAQAAEWVLKKTKGFTDYYYAKNVKDAATITLKESAKERNKSRRRALIREYWKTHDNVRFTDIARVFDGVKK